MFAYALELLGLTVATCIVGLLLVRVALPFIAGVVAAIKDA